MLVPSSSWEHSAAQHTIALHPPTQRHPFLLCITRNPLETHPAPLLCDLSEHSRILLCCRDERVSKQSTTTERPTGAHANHTHPRLPLSPRSLSFLTANSCPPVTRTLILACIHPPHTPPRRCPVILQQTDYGVVPLASTQRRLPLTSSTSLAIPAIRHSHTHPHRPTPRRHVLPRPFPPAHQPTSSTLPFLPFQQHPFSLFSSAHTRSYLTL